MALSISPTLVLKAAQKRGWKTNILSEQDSLYCLELPGGELRYIRSVSSQKSSEVGNFICKKKELVYGIANELGIRAPATIQFADFCQAIDFMERYKKAVVKPSDGSHGDGITVDITEQSQLKAAIAYAREFSESILLQQQIEGDDHRLLFIGGTLAAAAIRKPAFVTGDGRSSVRELIRAENGSSKRVAGYQEALTHIHEPDAQRYLGNEILDSIPEKGTEVRVMGTANIGKGGVSIDVTDTVDKSLVREAKKLVDHLSMGICGVDFIVDKAGDGYMIEINAVPSLGLHENPYRGKKQNTPDKFLDWLAENS